MKDLYIHEMCPYCNIEVQLINDFRVQVCPECGELIKPCSICPTDYTRCSKCILGGN